MSHNYIYNKVSYILTKKYIFIPIFSQPYTTKLNTHIHSLVMQASSIFFLLTSLRELCACDRNGWKWCFARKHTCTLLRSFSHCHVFAITLYDTMGIAPAALWCCTHHVPSKWANREQNISQPTVMKTVVKNNINTPSSTHERGHSVLVTLHRSVCRMGD